MKKTATATALLLGLGAGSASAQVVVGPNDMQGSDTLFVIMQELLAPTRLNIAPADLTYVGGGSGTGPAAMQTSVNRQEIAPSSRFFSATECSSTSKVSGVTGGYAIAQDGIVNVTGSAGPACAALAWDQTLNAVDLNGTAGIQGPASTTFPDWRTVIRIIYSGRVDAGASAAQDCNSDLRHTLVSQWTNLFKGGCAAGTCTAGLKHAFRRDDVSGTTDSFLELLQLPRFTSNPPPTVSPFCNGFDNQDNDPIRRSCQGNGFAGAGEEVCGLGSTTNAADPRNNTLGLVIPSLIPQENAYGLSSTPPALATQNCGPNALGGALFADVQWVLQDIQRYGARCPNGAPVVGGTCKWPKRVGTGAGQGFGCLASRGDKPAGSPPAFDGRVYNLWHRSGNGTVLTYQRNTQQIRANVSYYRAHQIGGCREPDSTEQIGCFTTKDLCSIGFAGVGTLQIPGTEALGIRSINPDGPGGAYENVIPPPLNDPNRVAVLARYGLSRSLWFLTYDEFASTGAQPASFVTAQQSIWNAIETGNAHVNSAVAAAGFYTVPTPYAFQACP